MKSHKVGENFGSIKYLKYKNEKINFREVTLLEKNRPSP